MKQITDAYNAIPVPETVLNANVYNACAKYQRRKKVRVSRILITACLVIALMGGTALAFNAELREFVILFFKTEQVESPVFHTESPTTTLPDGALNGDGASDEPTGYFLGQQEIDGIVLVRYYKFDNGFDFNRNTILVNNENGDEVIYGFLGQDLTELTKYHVEDVLQIGSYSIPLSFSYVIDDGMIKTFENIYNMESGGQATAINTIGSEFAWIQVSIRYEYYNYVQYNLRTGEIRDVISEAGIQMKGDSDKYTEISLSPDERMMLINDWDTVYLIDVESASARELTGLSAPDELNFSMSFIDNDTLTVWQQTGDDTVRFSVYWYDIKSDIRTIVVEDMPYYSPNANQHSGVRGLGLGITVIVEPDHYILIDDVSGIRYTVEGITPSPDIDFLLSPDRNLVSVTTMSNQNGFGITQLGCINIAKQELKVFDRVGFSDIYEWSMSWMSNNELVVLARIGYENQYMYVYQFK